MSPDTSAQTPSTPSGDRPLLAYASAAARAAAPAVESSTAIFRDADMLIVLNGSTLPPRCILCGVASASRAIPLTFTWDASFTLTRESTLQLRQKAAIHAFLCPRHQDRFMRGRILGCGAAVVSFLVTIVGLGLAVLSESSQVPDDTPLGIVLIISGFAGVIFSLFYFALRTRTLSCTLIRDHYLYLEGTSEEFLKSIPPLPVSAGTAPGAPPPAPR